MNLRILLFPKLFKNGILSNSGPHSRPSKSDLFGATVVADLQIWNRSDSEYIRLKESTTNIKVA